MLLPYNPSRRTAASLKRKKNASSSSKSYAKLHGKSEYRKKKKEDLEEKRKEKANLKNFHRRSYILIFALADFPLYKSLES